MRRLPAEIKYLISKQFLYIKSQSHFSTSQPLLDLKFSSPPPKGFLHQVPLEQLIHEERLSQVDFREYFKEAGVFKPALNIWILFQSFINKTEEISPEMMKAIIAWTHSKSKLSKRYYSGFETETEHQLYEEIKKFTEMSFTDPNSSFRIKQKLLCRAIESKYLDLFSETGLNFQTLLAPPKQELVYMREYSVYPSPSQFPKDSVIQFNPVTSWTLYNLTKKIDSQRLGYAYTATLDADIIFVGINAHELKKGGSIQTVSLVPHEKEVLLPSEINVRILKAGHMKRTDRVPVRNPVYHEGKPIKFYEDVVKLIHIIYVEFIN